MTKVVVACPFSHKSCKECPIYIGRHSQLCVAARYQNGGSPKPKPTYGCTNLKWELPIDLADKDITMKNIEDREENLKEVTIVWK
jgi:hypothetical protein